MTELIQSIDAPIELIYQRLIDLPGRMNWMDGITRVEMSDNLPNQIGKVHRCVRGDDDGIAVTTTEVKISDTTMELWEMDQKQMSACRYLLTRKPGDKAELAVEFFVRDNLIVRLMYKMLMEKKLKASFQKSIANLATVCERSYRPGQGPVTSS